MTQNFMNHGEELRTPRMHHLPAIITIGCSFTLLLSAPGCSAGKQSAQDGLESAQIAFSQTLTRCPALTLLGDSYLVGVVSRLYASAKPNDPIPTVKILNCAEPLAVSDGASEIGISSGLLQKLHNEAELAFVVAHEWSHLTLGHFKADVSTLPAEDRQNLELSADHHAIGMSAWAGYDPRAAALAVSRAQWDLQRQDLNYPTPQVRLEALQRAIAKSNWTPPGIVDTRDFRVFRGMF
jgi:hypothetical protein